ncbi:MAG: DUF1937 family protein, partial [Desulfamplus sp.]|nr:DUF1937 family protein [Desulfamplus sp.]
MKKIYLAIPYSHESPEIRVTRYQAANRKAAELMKAGNIVFSPISHSHPIANQECLPLDAGYWQTMNESFIDWSDIVVVYRLAGGQHSRGVQAEIDYATKTGKPVEYI